MSNLLKKAIRGITDPDYRFMVLAQRGKLNSMPDEKYLKKIYHARIGKTLNLENPQTYNEKMQWLKLYDRKPIYPIMADKYRARQFIRERVGEEFVVPMLGVWESPDDIDFDALPEQFVLKCNHNSGLGMCICTDKTGLDIPKVRQELQRGLDQDYYLDKREWPYKDIPRRIIGEPFLSDEYGNGFRDYKFLCFNGQPRIMTIASDGTAPDGGRSKDYYDMDFNRLPIQNGCPNSNMEWKKPENFDKMREAAKVLSADVPFLRVDFFEIGGHVYCGELTFYHWAGLAPFKPESWDRTLGEWVTLPEKAAR